MNSCLPNPHLPLLPPTAVPPPPTSTAPPANNTNTMDPHNTSLSSNEPQFSSPIRPGDKPENGLRINYEGRVSILGHGPIYGGGNGDVSTTLDDSREERGWTTDDQMSPKEQSSSPDAMIPKSSTKSDEDESSPVQRPSGDSLERLREICNKSLPQPGNTMIDTASKESIQADGSTLFHCHLCAYTSTSRDEFNEHVNDHYEFRCPKCEFDTKSEQEYKTHLKDEHNLTPEDLDDDQGIRVPKINSQGKVKVFKCKQCEFVAVTKEDFWRHTKIHIKPEKMLTCPKCPFVTEYKHHLEYHLRNHFGAKPFKCPNCSYTCVNKSMLNSHMKSHTNIYQYRCQDCNYATKYCHSLKLHLRKYNHKPAMVLNADGTPNPLPIIDVYGTRRGPKKKPGDENISLSPEGPNRPGPPKSPTSPGDHMAPQAPRFPLLPPFVMAQMRAQMEMQQSLGQASSPQRIAQVPPFSRSSNDEYPSLSSPVRKVMKNERGDSSEMDEDERSLNGSEKLKCAICDFETVSHDIYRNHLMLHATKEDSPPPSTSLPSVTLPQYPLQIRSPLSINAGAKAAAAAAAASAFLNRERPLSSSNESENEAPSSSMKTDEKESQPLDYLDYLKKMAPGLAPLAPLLQKSMNPSPVNPLISSSTTGGSPPVTGPSPSELISRLYGNLMSKNLSQTFDGSSGLNPLNPLVTPLPSSSISQTPTQKPSQTSSIPVADSSSGALDLSQLNKEDSPMPSRPQSGSQTSTQSGSGSKSSRRKGKAFKIERKMVATDDRDSLNSGQSEYSNEHDVDEAKSDGSTASKEAGEAGTTSLGTMLAKENSNLRTRMKAMQETIDHLTAEKSKLLADKVMGAYVKDGVADNDISAMVTRIITENEELKAKLLESEFRLNQLSQISEKSSLKPSNWSVEPMDESIGNNGNNSSVQELIKELARKNIEKSKEEQKRNWYH